jgi:predicted transcriptional regulator
LVEFFSNNIQQLIKKYDAKPRIYVYSAKKEKKRSLLNIQTNFYKDKRARKPYYIFRVASVNMVKQWKIIAEKIKHNKKFYTNILIGFFAGEGNLKEGINSNRTIRIAQGKPNKFIEKMLKYHGIKYRYEYHGRAYAITGKWNWDIIANNKLADLHTIKKEKFWRLYNSYKEIHYPNNIVRNNILKILNKPYTTIELSRIFKRSPARIRDILIPLKREGILKNFKVRSRSYWIKTDRNKIIISKIKDKYLKSLKREKKTTTEVAKTMDVCWKAAHRRLFELQKLNLVVRDSEGVWKISPKKEEVIVL